MHCESDGRGINTQRPISHEHIVARQRQAVTRTGAAATPKQPTAMLARARWRYEAPERWVCWLLCMVVLAGGCFHQPAGTAGSTPAEDGTPFYRFETLSEESRAQPARQLGHEFPRLLLGPYRLVFNEAKQRYIEQTTKQEFDWQTTTHEVAMPGLVIVKPVLDSPESPFMEPSATQEGVNE